MSGIETISSFKERKDFQIGGRAFLSFSATTLSHLRISLERMQPGMSDFIARVSTPAVEGTDKSGTIVSIRGNRALSKSEGVKKFAKVLVEELKEQGDTTYDWEGINLDHLTDLLFGTLKVFASNAAIIKMEFVTDAVL